MTTRAATPCCRLASCCVCVSSLLLAAWCRPSFSWIAHLGHVPSWLWDGIHGWSAGSPGGIWHYGPGVHNDLVCYIDAHYHDYASLLDVATNLGLVLARLQDAHPTAAHVGSDVSQRMVEATRARCPACTAQQFDLHALLDPGFEPGAVGAPKVAELVLVSDVLYYMNWAGWPPLLLRYVVPEAWVRASQRRFFSNLRRLASVEVIFSSHQLNPTVVSALETGGAKRRHGVYSLGGGAPRAGRERRPWWRRSLPSQQAALRRFRRCLNGTATQLLPMRTGG